MTKLNPSNGTVKRETGSTLQGKKLVVELGVYAVSIRLKGKRRKFEVPYEALYWIGAKIEAARLQRERQARRQKRRA